MLTRGDFTLVLLTVLATGAVVAMAQSEKSDKKPVMKSSAIEWNSIEAKPNANGAGKRFFDGPSPTLENLECHATTLKPGVSNHEIVPRPHDEVVIVKEGTIEAYVGDKWVRVGPGSVIFNAANENQAMRNVGDGPATYHVVVIRPGATGSQPTTKAAG